MTNDRSDSTGRIREVFCAAALAAAMLMPLKALADQSGNAGGNATERASDRGQEGLDRARETERADEERDRQEEEGEREEAEYDD